MYSIQRPIDYLKKVRENSCYRIFRFFVNFTAAIMFGWALLLILAAFMVMLGGLVTAQLVAGPMASLLLFLAGLLMIVATEASRQGALLLVDLADLAIASSRDANQFHEYCRRQANAA